MKKIVLFVLAMLISFSCTSCHNSNDLSDTLQETEAELLSFRSADINMADDFLEILCTDKRMANYLIFGKLQSGEYCGYITNIEFAEKKSFIFNTEEDETVRSAALMRFGKSAVLTTLNESTFIYTFDCDGNPENTFDLGEILTPDDHFAELICTENGFYINIDRYALAYIDMDGNFKGTVNVSGRTVCGIVNDSNDDPCVLMSQNSKMTLGTLSELNITEETECGELADYTNSVCTGMGDYRIAVMVTGGLYGLKGNEWQHITDFVDNDFGTSDILDIEMISADEYTVVIRKNDEMITMRLLSKRDISEIKQKKIIKLAYMFNSNTDPYSDVMKRYNADNDEFKIELVCYKGDFPSPFEQLRLDIISGNCPDIVQFSSFMTVESFGSSDDIFVDLYEYLDRDNEICRNDFLDGFLEGMETNGKLLKLAPSFSINTNIIKNKFADGLTSWNYNEFESMCQNLPNDMNFSGQAVNRTKTQMFLDIINYGKFIDKDNAKCSFDSSEFIHAMKLINDNEIGIKSSEYGKSNSYNSIDAFRNDDNLVLEHTIKSIKEIRWIKYVYASDDFTFIGYPSDERITAYCQPTSTYGIMANSPYKDEAWKFIKQYMFSEDGIKEPQFGDIPALEKFYIEDFNYQCETHPYIDPDTGEMTDKDYYYYYPANVSTPTIIEMFPFDEVEAKKYDEFIRTAVKHHKYTNNSVRTILMDELDSYFEGEKSAEQVAEIIQNRVSIYLSEQS